MRHFQQLIIARNDAGDACKFRFTRDGYWYRILQRVPASEIIFGRNFTTRGIEEIARAVKIIRALILTRSLAP